MDSWNGKNLVETFSNLGINTGNISKTTIEAWFDTDCEATKNLLSWMCANLNQDNVLTIHENEEYESCLKNKSLLHDKRYYSALDEVKAEFPDILEYEDNLFDVECMEDELESLLEQERDLKHTLTVNTNIQKLLTKKTAKATEEDLNGALEREKMENTCRELSVHLDELHQKLFYQIRSYANHLEEFEHASKPVFLSNIPVNKQEQYISDIESYLNLMLNKRGAPSINSTMLSTRKNFHESFLMHQPDELEIVWQRLYESQKSLLYKQVKEETLKAEIDFVKNLSINDLMVSSNDVSAQFMLEANNLSRENQLKHLLFEAENGLKQKTDLHVNGPKINAIKKDIISKKKELELLKEQNVKVTKILALQQILGLLYEAEGNDIKVTEEFFSCVYSYIVNDLAGSITRKELMSKLIEDYKTHKELPLEQQHKLFEWMKTFLSEGATHSCNLIHMVKMFEYSYKSLEIKAFVDDYKHHRQFSKQFTTQIKIIKKFLINGPTKQILILPNKAARDLSKNSQLLENYENLIYSVIEMKKNAEKRLENDKWFKMKRQLWMFFLTDPQMAVQSIKQISIAVQKARRALV